MDNKPHLRASSAGQWINCPVSPWLSIQHGTNYNSNEAMEGTAAHEMGEMLLSNTVSTGLELVDRRASNGYVFDANMIGPVETYTNYIKSYGVPYWVEENVKIQDGNMVAPVTGRNDTSLFFYIEKNPNDGQLVIVDFKYGYRPVNIYNNWQLNIYAIGMWLKLKPQGYHIQKFKLVVVQPRAYHHDGPIREYEFDIETIVELYNEMVSAVNKVYSESRVAKTGEWCRDCPGLAYCDAAKHAGMNAIDVANKPLPDEETQESIAHKLNELYRAEGMIKHLLTAMEARAEGMIKEGKPIPGYTFMPGTGQTRFVNPEKAKEIASAYGVNITDNKTVTPAEAKRRGLPDFIVDKLTYKPSTKPRLINRDQSTKANKVFKDV